MLKKLLLINSLLLASVIYSENSKMIASIKTYSQDHSEFNILQVLNKYKLAIIADGRVFEGKQARKRLVEITRRYVIISRQLEKQTFTDGSVRYVLIESHERA